MKSERKYKGFVISPKAEAALRKGHVWVYGEEIRQEPEGWENGEIADVFSGKGAYLGTGLVSRQSKIRIRILTTNANDMPDETFFRRRVRYAYAYRKTVMGDDLAYCRLLFGEADGLPGVTVDRYGDLLVAQILSYGMESRKAWIYDELRLCLAEEGVTLRGIMERNDAAIRELEGLSQGKGWYTENGFPHPESAVTTMVENGIQYHVDLENGQKTGFFLDQKYNRRAVASIARGKRVLDCFTHTGSFALNAALGGAAHVTAVDVSQAAVDMAHENAVLNHLEDRMDFLCADVFDLLPSLLAQHSPYDLIILDPPAFTKSRKTVSDATRGYKEINYRAMRLLPRGGYLATCSCSHFMEKEKFREMLLSAAQDAGVGLKLIEERGQAPDHPILMTVPETDYLKFYLFQIV